jgi:hypothetical protein
VRTILPPQMYLRMRTTFRAALGPPAGDTARCGRRPRTAALATALAVALSACATGPSEDVAPAVSAGSPDDAVQDGDEAPAEAVIEGDDLSVVDGDGATTRVATVEDAELLTASIRPGGVDPLTVLALTRTAETYELRYADVSAGESTDLYWFPFRLRVELDPDVADVPPTPVWAPDGSGIAWLEWDEDGTRLRTVGWLVHEAGTNPSDDQTRYRLEGVPEGVQLTSWEVDSDGISTLTSAVVDGERWRIRLGPDGPSAASSIDT